MRPLPGGVWPAQQLSRGDSLALRLPGQARAPWCTHPPQLSALGRSLLSCNHVLFLNPRDCFYGPYFMTQFIPGNSLRLPVLRGQRACEAGAQARCPALPHTDLCSKWLKPVSVAARFRHSSRFLSTRELRAGVGRPGARARIRRGADAPLAGRPGTTSAPAPAARAQCDRPEAGACPPESRSSLCEQRPCWLRCPSSPRLAGRAWRAAPSWSRRRRRPATSSARCCRSRCGSAPGGPTAVRGTVAVAGMRGGRLGRRIVAGRAAAGGSPAGPAARR